MSTSIKNERSCTLCDRSSAEPFKIAGMTVIKEQNVHYQLCASCFSTRPQPKTTGYKPSTGKKDNFWQEVYSKALTKQESAVAL